MSSENHSYDVIVVGAGAFGLSTALFLSTHYPKLKVALIEQFNIGHDHGSSHSQIRIIRSIYANLFYRDLCVLGIKEYWPQAEKLLGEKLLVPNPCIMFIEPENEYRQIEATVASSQGQLEILSQEQVYSRFPSAPKVQFKHPVIIDNGAAIGFAERFIQLSAEYLKKCPQVTVMQQTEMISFDSDEAGVTMKVRNKERSFELKSKKASLSCGRWITQLVPQMAEIMTEVPQTVSYWQMKQPENYQIGKFPSWRIVGQDGLRFYGLPDVNGDGLKYALHCHDTSFYPNFKNNEAYESHMKQLYMERTERYFKGKAAKLKKLERCYYTDSKTEDMLMDWSDEHDNVLIVSPCSGQGYKFSAILGKIAADLLVKDESLLLVKDESLPLFEQNRHYFRMFYHLGVHL